MMANAGSRKTENGNKHELNTKHNKTTIKKNRDVGEEDKGVVVFEKPRRGKRAKSASGQER